MAKIAAFIITTLDGLDEGPGGTLDWHPRDPEFRDFAAKQLEDAGFLVFGRKTYDLFSAYWQGAEAQAEEPGIASQLSMASKVVLSRHLSSASWAHTRVEKDLREAADRWKRSRADTALVLGSASVVRELLRQRMLDELRLLTVPRILAEGRSFYRELPALCLRVVQTRVFAAGALCSVYRPRYP